MPSNHDKSEALAAAVELMKATRFAELADVLDDVEAAERVIEVANTFIVWFRKITGARLTLVAIEEIDTGTVVSTGSGGSGVTNIDTSQRARYVIDAQDDRNFPVDGTLGFRSSDEAVVTTTIMEAPGTESGKDEAVATFAGLGTATVELFDPANPTVVLAADVIVVNPGGVAAAQLGSPIVEEIPTP